MAFTTGDNNFNGIAKWIVNTQSGLGTHTTLASAMASASSGDTISLMSSVTENVTLTPGVNIIGPVGGSLNTPSITGTLTMTGAGTTNISDIRLITNSAACIAVTGSAASILNINNCFINCSNNTGITFSTSSSSAQININNCIGNLGTTGISYFTHSSAGSIKINNCYFNNSGPSITASTISAGGLEITNSTLRNAITSSGTTSIIAIFNTNINPPGDVISITCNSTVAGDNNIISNCRIRSSTVTASECITIGAGASLQVVNTTLTTNFTNVITGAGTVQYGGLVFGGTSSLITTTTQTISPYLKGQPSNISPSSGFIGELLTNSATGVSVTSTVSKEITNQSLTAGIWLVWGTVTMQATTSTTTLAAGVNAATVTFTTVGLDYSNLAALPISSGTFTINTPIRRISLSGTSTYYLNINSGFVGTGTAGGYLYALRVG